MNPWVKISRMRTLNKLTLCDLSVQKREDIVLVGKTDGLSMVYSTNSQDGEPQSFQTTRWGNAIPQQL